MATNNIALATVTLFVGPALPGVPGAPVVLPVGGDDVAASFVPGDDYIASEGINGLVFSAVLEPSGSLTINAYATDPINTILRNIRNQDRAAGGALRIGGLMTDSAGQRVSWVESKIITPAPMSIEQTATIKAWEISISKFDMSQGLPLLG